MNRIIALWSWIILIALFLILPACRERRVPPPSYQAAWSDEKGSQHQSELYTKAEALFEEKQYEEVVGLLSGPVYNNPLDFKLNVLLAKAQVEKCAILKEKGDETYKSLIRQPFATSQRLHDIRPHPEIYYIAAKSLFINNRANRAKRTIKKALYYSPNNPDYLLTLGNICYTLAERKKDDPYRTKKLFSEAKSAYEKVKEIVGTVEDYVEVKIEEISEKLK